MHIICRNGSVDCSCCVTTVLKNFTLQIVLCKQGFKAIIRLTNIFYVEKNNKQILLFGANNVMTLKNEYKHFIFTHFLQTF